MAFGVADGVGGWVESGVDPSLFSQALMYHAHRYSRSAWAGEPEVDPTLDYEEREQIEGWEMTPYECLGLSYDGVLREKVVQAGGSLEDPDKRVPSHLPSRFKHRLYHHFECGERFVTIRQVRCCLPDHWFLTQVSSISTA